MPENDHISFRRKLTALREVAEYRPSLTLFIVLFSLGAATLEAVGLGFILPIIEIVRSTGDPTANATGALGVFVSVYEFLNIPFTLATVVGGVMSVLTIRYISSFLVSWLQAALSTEYVRHLQDIAFTRALNARTQYYDEEGSDDILNAIITQTGYAGGVIGGLIGVTELLLMTLVYAGVAFYISPFLTIATGVLLGGITYLLRSVIEPGARLGNLVADANEQRQRAAQAGTQGIRDIRIFGLAQELQQNFREAIDTYTETNIKLQRNESALTQFYDLAIAVTIFGLIFFALRVANLSLSELGVFLFAMFRLGPKVSNLNSTIYSLENQIPHLVRTQEFIEKLKLHAEPEKSSVQTPSQVRNIAFRDVEFGYSNSETVLKGISFEASQDEFIAFVGQSGAGKSTIAALLSRLYEPDRGEILANNRDITQMDIDSWRDRIAVVRQQPFIFSDTLRYNLTIADRDATQSDIDRVCEIARVDEFFDELPHGYETKLGEDGVRLSGGQKQRVALARALLADADILILDEATSDLDTNLESQVQSAIEQMDNNYIIVTIAHRLSTIKNADRIYTIDDGNIIESGCHKKLLQSEGKYAKLYATQAAD
jgi:ABC-type multidrug transport system, ATPase and permease components